MSQLNNSRSIDDGSSNLSDRIAKCALHHYHRILPSNNGSKPQKGREWTVYAAIVAVRSAADGSNSCANQTSGSAAIKSEGVEDMWVVSCATGSKCTSVNSVVSTFPSGTQNSDDGNECTDDAKILQSYNGMVLKDSHAEVLSRRGLVLVLWNEIESTLKQMITDQIDASSKSDFRHLLQVLPHTNKLGLLQFSLKNDITLHMYISDSPCGDATIYEIKRLKNVDSNVATETHSACCEADFETDINFTGAKLILTRDEDVQSESLSEIITVTTSSSGTTNEASSTIKLGREHIQHLGALRLKSSRSNIPSHFRSTSMSCSDKFVRWGLLGLQGSLLMAFIPEPIRLTSVCVSKDPRSLNGGQLEALERALRDRIFNALKTLQHQSKYSNAKPPAVSISDHTYESSKSESENRYMLAERNSRKRRVSEVLTGHRMIQPSKKAKLDIENANETDSLKFKPGQRTKKESPSGMSINWFQLKPDSSTLDFQNAEVTVGATGLKRGKKPKLPQDVMKSASRLCRYNIISQSRKCFKLSSQLDVAAVTGIEKVDTISRLVEHILDDSLSYSAIKQTVIYQGAVGSPNEFFRACDSDKSPLYGWVRSGTASDFKTS